MKKLLFPILLTALMLVGWIPMLASPVDAATAPTKMWVEPSETNNIPMQIEAFKQKTGGTNANPTYTYQIYLPGNVDPSDCYLSWDGGATATVGTTTYESGSCPIPSIETQTRYTFKSGNTTLSTLNFITYRGTPNVQTVFIDVDESDGKPTIAQMDADKKVECSGRVNINGTWYVMTKMKGRGNATWTSSRDKKPYNVTLDGKINFPGISSEKTKKWSFLAEVTDHSLLCNRAGFILASELGVGQDTTSADVWMNGEYQGCYMVTPKTDSFVSKNGFMIEQDNYKEDAVASGGDPQFTLTGLKEATTSDASHYNRITVKKMGDNLLLKDGVVDESAENMTHVANDIIRPWLQDALNAILSETGYNDKGKHYSDYIDVESFAKMYLVHEYIKSYDVCAGSILFHRDGMTDADKLIAGPAWDMDNALGATCRNGNLGSVGDRRSGSGDFIPNITEYKTSIYKNLGKHPEFMEEVIYQYNKHKKAFDNLPGGVDALIDEIQVSAMMNHYKVQDLGNNMYTNTHYYGSNTTIGSGQYSQSYKATTNAKTDWHNYADNLKTYVTTRTLWFANNYYDEDFVDPDTCEHQYETVTVPATCTTPGSITYTCPICKNTYTEEIPVIAHDYQDGVCTVCEQVLLTADITCDPGASVTVYETQDIEGASQENATSAHPRDSSSGLIDCSGEGQINFVVKLDDCHELDSVTAEPASAYKNLKVLTERENSYRITKVSGDLTITVTTTDTHDYGELVAKKDATCTEDGMEAYYQCATCEKYFDADKNETTLEDLTIPATGHDYGELVAKKDATCTEAGMEAHYQCSVCEKYFDADKNETTKEELTIEAKGHSWGKWEVTKPATCTEDGVETRVCANDESHKETRAIEATGHDYGELVAKKNATCTEAGMEAHYQCSVCEKYFDTDKNETTVEELTIPATGHSWGDWEVTTPATCTEDGVETRVCANDDAHKETRTIEATGHDYGELVAKKDATCTEAGMEAHYQCSVCETYFDADKNETTKKDLIIPTAGHDYGELVAKKDATCTEAGMEAHYQCPVCEIYFDADKNETTVEELTIPATGHSWGNWEVTKPATCTEDGVETRVCANDDSHKETRAIDATGHDYGELVAKKDATCTEAGMESHYQCATCETYFDADKNETTKEELTIEAKGHSWGEWEVTKPATCTEDGVETRVCANDDSHKETRTIEATGHDYGELVAKKDATCAEAGMEAHYQCSVCEKYFDADKNETTKEELAIEAKGHSWGEWEVTKAATCTEDGVETRVCANDDSHKETRTIEATGHDYGELVAKKEATCTEAGMEAYYQCAVCEKYFDADKNGTTVEELTIPAAGHDYGELVAKEEATCTEAGMEAHYQCAVCEKYFDADKNETTEENLIIPTSGHQAGEPVKENQVAANCEEDGSYDVVTYCTVCEEELSRETKTVQATGHDYGELVEKEDATCTEDGMEAHFQCSVCEKYFVADKKGAPKEALIIKATGHKPNSEYTLDKAPSCTEAGSESIHCLICDEIDETTVRTIPATGHTFGAWEEITSSTCTDPGLKQRICEVCGLTESENLSPNGHDWENEYTTDLEPTCTLEGSRSKHCKNCDAVNDSQTIPALGHEWGEWVVITEPTIEMEGERERECSVCHEKETEIIAKISPQTVAEEALAELDLKNKKVEELADVATRLKQEADEAAKTPGTEAVTAAKNAEEAAEAYLEAAQQAKEAANAATEAVENAVAAATTEEEIAAADLAQQQLTELTANVDSSITDAELAVEAAKAAVAAAETALERSTQRGTDGTAVGPGASDIVADKAITTRKSDADPDGSVFRKLKLKTTKQTNTSIKITWTKLSSAKKYVVYGNACGSANKMKKLTSMQGNVKTFSTVAGKKVKKGTYYKFIVVGLDENSNVVSTSKIIHVATKGGKVGNHKSVRVSKKVINKAKNLKKGKTLKLRAKAVKASKRTVKSHRGVRYESSNTKIATVTKKGGTVTAKAKGTCYIYAYAQNGVTKKIKVVVK